MKSKRQFKNAMRQIAMKTQFLLGCSKISSSKEVHSKKDLPQTSRKISNNIPSKSIRKGRINKM